MDFATVRAALGALPGAEETFPFGPDVLVFKVCGKMFALMPLVGAEPPRVNLKCDPERALALRHAHPAVLPGYHMSKRHWNTVLLDDSLPPALIAELLEHSYALVVAGLKKADQRALERA